MSKIRLTKPKVPGYKFVKKAGDIEEYILSSNGLRVLYLYRSETQVITTNITYLVGARDEKRGETGIAHMLEHMLFKPTTFDVKNKVGDSSAMKFERDTGCVLNANTWKDRTTYYFSYPKKYFSEALQIEAERMTGTILNEKELAPEQGNVLSEFDMYNGDPHYALHVEMCSAAFFSHPYGHETLGYREDIEDYNPEKLEKFYRDYYRPDNAVMMVIGDIELTSALLEVKRQFATIKNPATPIPCYTIREPKQEGIRRVRINRPSTTNIISLGFKHKGFPTLDWFVSSLLLEVLTSGPESILHKLLIDQSKASNVSSMIEPTKDSNIAVINISLAPNQKHDNIENLVLDTIRNLKLKDITSLLKKTKEQIITDELLGRDKSLRIASELTEYTAAGSWETYTKTTEILAGITPKMILESIHQSFTESNLTIGHFVGTNIN